MVVWECTLDSRSALEVAQKAEIGKPIQAEMTGPSALFVSMPQACQEPCLLSYFIFSNVDVVTKYYLVWLLSTAAQTKAGECTIDQS